MQYRVDKKSGNKLSILGFGCMRFPRNLTGALDIKKAQNLVARAIEAGVNYFDTAWLYPGSEEALGLILENLGCRDKVFIATKLPIALCRNAGDFDVFFSQELQRLRTDYIDYYLLHMLTDTVFWERLKAMGIEEWIAVKKKAGKIRHMGFSFHGNQKEFPEILDSYPWDFCQIQYNYSDENFQAGRTGLKKAAAAMPVIIMEPLLGGKLARPPKAVADILRKANPDRSPAAWALNWLWDQEEPTVVLSGMSEISQLEENAALAAAAVPGMLTVAERETYGRVKTLFDRAFKIRCTGCHYCMPCPRGVNIPGAFAAYNTSYSMGWYTAAKSYFTGIGITAIKTGSVWNCVKCGTCESHCPQKIPVIKALGTVKRRIEPFWLHGVVGIFRFFLNKRRA
jgi:predicted aldo/keto reductase-like oxidoreductase